MIKLNLSLLYRDNVTLEKPLNIDYIIKRLKTNIYDFLDICKLIQASDKISHPIMINKIP